MPNLGLKIGFESEREIKKSLSEINSSFKILGSEIKFVQKLTNKSQKHEKRR